MAEVLNQHGVPATTIRSEPTPSTLPDTTVESATTTSSNGDGNALVPILVGLAALGLFAAVIVITRKPRRDATSPESARPPSAKNP